MRKEDMSLRTKEALAGALKSLMADRPLSKVTVSDIARACDLNRNTFYYHFEDVNDLLRWMLEREAMEVVRRIDPLENTDEAIRFVIDYVTENRHILACAYDSLGHEEMKRFLYSDLIGIMRGSIERGAAELGLEVEPEFVGFVAAFYTEGLAGMLVSWLHPRREGFAERGREELLADLTLVCSVSIPDLLRAGAARRA